MADTPTASVVKHALGWYEREYGSQPRNVFLLEPTSPLRCVEDIWEAAALLGDGDCNAVMGVCEAHDPPQWTLHARADGTLEPADKDRYLLRRQDLPMSYIPGPIYAIETRAFLETEGFLTNRTRFFVVPRERAIDIDTEIDFLFAELLLERGHGAMAAASC